MATAQESIDRFVFMRGTPMPNGVRPLVVIETVVKEPLYDEESRIVTYAIFVPGVGNVVGQRLDASPVRFATINNTDVLDVPSVDAAYQLALLRAQLYLDAVGAQLQSQPGAGSSFGPIVLEKLPDSDLRVLAMVETYGPAWEQFKRRAAGEALQAAMKKCVKWRNQWFASELAALPQHAAPTAHQPT